jgi:azurin
MKIATTLSILAGGLLASNITLASDCSLSIDSTDSMQFSTDQLTVDAACSEVELTLTHSGTLPRNAMGHNWVLTRSGDAQAVNQDGMQAGLDNEYVQPDDARVIAHTPVIGGGEEASVTFSIEGLAAGADYTFFCSFPGHFAIMQGDFRIVEGG